MFSPELMKLIEAEASKLGMVGATSISTAIREQLTSRKTRGAGVRDGRHQSYFVAGRVILHGHATPLPGCAPVVGLDTLSGLAVLAAQYAGTAPPAPDCALRFVGSTRTSLSRSGHAHVVVVLPVSKQAPDKPDCWVDLWIFKTEAEALAHANTLKPEKVF